RERSGHQKMGLAAVRLVQPRRREPLAMPRPLLSIVVPVYKEEGNIQPFLQRIVPILKSLPLDYEVIFCLDPSPDQTEQKIRAAIAKDKHVRLMIFSRRFGQ